MSVLLLHGLFSNRWKRQEDNFVALFPGVEDTLEALSHNYKLAIISNGNRKRLQNNLEKMKLTGWIDQDRLFSSEKDGPRKPHPAIFERALKTMSAASNQSVMVGNSWRNDVVGAASSGMDAIWIHPGNIKKISERRIGKQKVIIIRSFKQLIIHVLIQACPFSQYFRNNKCFLDALLLSS